MTHILHPYNKFGFTDPALERILQSASYPYDCDQFINVMASVIFPTPTLLALHLYLGAHFCQQPGSVNALFSFIFSIITVIPLLSSHYFHLFLFPLLYFVVWPPLFSMGLVNLEDQRSPYSRTLYLSLLPLATKIATMILKI